MSSEKPQSCNEVKKFKNKKKIKIYIYLCLFFFVRGPDVTKAKKFGGYQQFPACAPVFANYY